MTKTLTAAVVLAVLAVPAVQAYPEDPGIVLVQERAAKSFCKDFDCGDKNFIIVGQKGGGKPDASKFCKGFVCDAKDVPVVAVAGDCGGFDCRDMRDVGAVKAGPKPDKSGPKAEQPFDAEAANKVLKDYLAAHPWPEAGPPSPKQESKDFHKSFDEQDKKPKFFRLSTVLSSLALNSLTSWDVREQRAGMAEFDGSVVNHGAYSTNFRIFEANPVMRPFVNGSTWKAYGSQVGANALIIWGTDKLITSRSKGWKITGWSIRVLAGSMHAYLALDAQHKREQLRNFHP